MEKMRKREARKIVQEGVDIFFEEMKKGGCPIEVGRGDIRTEEDIAKIHQEMEGITWSAIRSQYILPLNVKFVISKTILGLIALSYFLHLETVRIPAYLAFGSFSVGIVLSCIVWCSISTIALILLISLNLVEYVIRRQRKNE